MEVSFFALRDLCLHTFVWMFTYSFIATDQAEKMPRKHITWHHSLSMAKKVKHMSARIHLPFTLVFGYSQQLWQHVEPCFSSEVQRRMGCLERKSFLDKMPNLDRGWAICYKEMTKEPALAHQKPSNWESKSPWSIWTRSQPSNCISKAALQSVPQKWNRKIVLSVDTFLLPSLLSVIVRPIHGWAGTTFGSQLIYPHFTSLQFTVYKAV